MCTLAGGTLAVVLMCAPWPSHAQEPAGAITIFRDIPARNAFRPGPPGPEYKVATAREDVVIANARLLENSVGSLAPDLIGQDRAFPAHGMLASQISASVAGAGLDAGAARLSASTIGGGAESLTAGAIATPMSSFAGTLNSMMRGR